MISVTRWFTANALGVSPVNQICDEKQMCLDRSRSSWGHVRCGNERKRRHKRSPAGFISSCVQTRVRLTHSQWNKPLTNPDEMCVMFLQLWRVCAAAGWWIQAERLVFVYMRDVLRPTVNPERESIISRSRVFIHKRSADRLWSLMMFVSFSPLKKV